MLISKVDLYCAKSKMHQAKNSNISFKQATKTNGGSLLPGTEWTYKDKTYQGIITYKEILALKELAESSKKGNYIPNIAIKIQPTSVADFIVATTQDKLLKGNPEWVDVNDYDNI